MRTALPALRSRLSGWAGPFRRKATASIIAGVAVLIIVAATISWSIASAGNDDYTGRAVSAEQLAVIKSAATACPIMASPPRIAGQLMAESGLDSNASRTTSGGQGLAGLDNPKWNVWKPWIKAERKDPAANIFALVHEMCDNSGKLIKAKIYIDPNIDGHLWRLSLAVHLAGLGPVTAEGTVPSSATSYVERVVKFTAWYETRSEFTTPLADGGANRQANPAPGPAASSSAPPKGSTPPPSGPPGGNQKLAVPPSKDESKAPAGAPPGAQPPVLSGKMLVQRTSNKCIDAGAATDGVHLTLRGCNAAAASQRWDVRSDGTIRSTLTGLCMDVANANTGNNARVQTHDCTGHQAQQWRFTSGVELRSVLADKCIDIDYATGENPPDGVEIDTWWCDKGNLKQAWTLK